MISNNVSQYSNKESTVIRSTVLIHLSGHFWQDFNNYKMLIALKIL